MQEIVVIDGEISLENTLDGEVELEAITDLDPEVVLNAGGGVTPSGTIEITENGTYNVTEYASADVDVQGGITPTGTKQISIASNGTVTEDVTNYASAEITTNVPASAVDTGTKSISSNGTHDVVGYASANVQVPNSYSASDEGKVVSNGALVAQTSDTVTTNDTYDTTLINSLTVNVSGGSGYTIDEVSMRSISGAVVLNTPTNELYLGSFALITSVTGNGPTTLDTGSLRYMNALTYVNLPNVTGVKNQNTTSYAIANDPNLEEMYLPKLQNVANGHMFRNNNKLHTADIGVTANIKGSTFNVDPALRVLILRKSDAVCELAEWSASCMGGIYSNPTLSTVYVPQALISSYQSATNWSSAYSAGLTFAQIEGSQYEL